MKTLLLMMVFSTVAFAEVSDPPEQRLVNSTLDPAALEEPVKLPRKGANEPRSLQLVSRPSPGTRIFVELGGGLAGAAAAAVIGTTVGCSAELVVATMPNRGCSTFTLILPAILALGLIPTGTYLAGDAIGSGGGMVGTVLGFVGGGIAIIPAVMFLLGPGGTFVFGPLVALMTFGAVAMTGLLPLIGAVIGHELSAMSSSPRDEASALTFSPSLGLGSDHAMAGLAVTF